MEYSKMVGIKGRSGRTSTMAQRQARIDAGLKSAAVRANKAHLPQEAIQRDESFLGPFLTIADYDKRLGPVMSWSDVERREKAIAQILGNDSLAIRNDVERGTLLTKEEVESRDEKWNEAVAASADQVQRLLDNVLLITADHRMAFLNAYRDWRSNLAKTLNDLAKR